MRKKGSSTNAGVVHFLVFVLYFDSMWPLTVILLSMSVSWAVESIPTFANLEANITFPIYTDASEDGFLQRCGMEAYRS
jgi:hypothetical protein